MLHRNVSTAHIVSAREHDTLQKIRRNASREYGSHLWHHPPETLRGTAMSGTLGARLTAWMILPIRLTSGRQGSMDSSILFARFFASGTLRVPIRYTTASAVGFS